MCFYLYNKMIKIIQMVQKNVSIKVTMLIQIYVLI